MSRWHSQFRVPVFPPSLCLCCMSGASWSRLPSSRTVVRAARKYAGLIHSDVLPNHCPPTIRKAQFAKPVVAFRFSARMHSQTMRSGDMSSVNRASFLDSAPCTEDCIYDDVAPVTSKVKPWSLSGLSLCDCPASLSDVFLTWVAY